MSVRMRSVALLVEIVPIPDPHRATATRIKASAVVSDRSTAVAHEYSYNFHWRDELGMDRGI